MGRSLPLLPEARTAIIAMAGGDGRYLLNMAEQVYAFAGVEPLDMAAMGHVVQRLFGFTTRQATVITTS